MKYLLKLTIIPFIYLVFMLVICLSVLMIPENLLWLRYVAAAGAFILFAVIIAGVFYGEGQTALKVRLANDMERRQIVLTGEDRPLKVKEEYATWKGFVAGALVCVPLVILLAVHTVLILTVGETARGAGAAAGTLYLIVFIFFSAGGSTVSVYAYYYTLIAIPVFMTLTGVPYMLGAKKIQRQQDELEEKHNAIYGERADDDTRPVRRSK